MFQLQNVDAVLREIETPMFQRTGNMPMTDSANNQVQVGGGGSSLHSMFASLDLNTRSTGSNNSNDVFQQQQQHQQQGLVHSTTQPKSQFPSQFVLGNTGTYGVISITTEKTVGDGKAATAVDGGRGGCAKRSLIANSSHSLDEGLGESPIELCVI
jgi:hypothetical protein